MASPSRFALGLFGAALLSPVQATLYTSVASLPSLSYDYIVVGGGTAGNVLANRLSANQNNKVLVIEAGDADAGALELNAEIPLFCPTLAPNTPVDWNYTTTPSSGFNGRSIPYPRGRVLGGSSTINFLVWNTGSRDDWDSLARVTGDQGWSWNSMKPFRAATEKFQTAGASSNEFSASAHSTTGMLSVSLPTLPTSLDSRINATLAQMPSVFPFQIDQNGGNTIGIGWAQASINNGQRSSSATAYLASSFLNRPNLAVLVKAEATKVIQNGTVNGMPRFGSVQFVSGGTTFTANAAKEIILSGGSFNSPKLLMLSGIGDSTALAKVGIPTIKNLPSVGQNMSDHVLLPNAYLVNGTNTFEDILNPNVLNDEVGQWTQTHKGPLANGLTSTIGWLRLPSVDPIFKKYADPSTGPTSGHFELIFANGFAVIGTPTPSTGHYMTVFTNLITPYSRGSVTLASSNPADAPVISPNFLAHEFDMHTMVAAVAASKLFLSASAWKDYVLQPWGPSANLNSEAAVETFIRQNSGSVWHAVGTAAMSPKGAAWGVVDPDLKVKGTVGLRVVDASVLPYVPAGHTQGPVYFMAERAASIIISQNA